MQKKVEKYFIPIILIGIVIVLGSIFIINNIYEPNITKNMKISLENNELLATTEINESSVNANNFTAPIIGSTVWPIETIKKYSDSNMQKQNGTIDQLTECMVTDVNNYVFKIKYITSGNGWNDSNAVFTEAWVDAHRLLINLPDVCPDIVYEIPNATKEGSIFKIGTGNNSVKIPNITGVQLYTYDEGRRW